jgi:tetratricopeptide (TPR) repeat protein
MKRARTPTALAVLPIAAALAAGAAAPPAPDLSRIDPALSRQLTDLSALIRRLEEEGGGTAERAEAYGTLGHLYLYYGLHEAARECYRSAAGLAPGDFRWPYYHGVLEADDGDAAAAARAFRAALALAPEDLPSWVRLGQAELDLDQPGSADERFRRALEIEPGLAAAWYGRGQVALREGRPADAAAHLERALGLAPQDPLIHYALAQAHRRQGDRERADRHLALYQEARGRRVESRVPMADPLMAAMGRITAVSSYGLVVALAGQRERFPDLQFFRFALGTLEGLRGAALRLEQDLSAWPGERQPGEKVVVGRLWYLLGGVAVQAGQNELAAERFRRALELLPDLDHGRIERARALLAVGTRAEAAAELARVFEAAPAPADALDADPSYVDGRLSLGLLLLDAGEPERALRQLKVAARRRPTAGRPHFAAAVAEVRLGRYGAAAARLGAALEQLPDAGEGRPLLRFLIRVRAAAPDPAARDGARAVALARQLEEAETSATSARELALALAEAGDLAGARQWLARARARDPEEPPVGLTRLLAEVAAGRPGRAGDPTELLAGIL